MTGELHSTGGAEASAHLLYGDSLDDDIPVALRQKAGEPLELGRSSKGGVEPLSLNLHDDVASDETKRGSKRGLFSSCNSTPCYGNGSTFFILRRPIANRLKIHTKKRE